MVAMNETDLEIVRLNKEAIDAAVAGLETRLKATMNQDPPEGLAAADIQKIVHAEVELLGDALTAKFDQVHHVCEDSACDSCRPVVAKIRADTIDKVEDRVPGTKERIQDYDTLNAPIEAPAAD